MLFKYYTFNQLLLDSLFILWEGKADSFSRNGSKIAREYFCHQIFPWRISNIDNKQMQKKTQTNKNQNKYTVLFHEILIGYYLLHSTIR